MEKTKKLSKSSIAVIVLAILLALSMIMGITGAWFTDRVGGDDQSVLNFGKVELGGTATTVQITESRNTTVNAKTVDGDKFTINAANVANNSTVGIFYRYEYEIELYTTTDGITKGDKVAADAVFSHTIDQATEATTKNVRESFYVWENNAKKQENSSYVSPFKTIDHIGYLGAESDTGAAFDNDYADQGALVIYFDSEGKANFDDTDPAYILYVNLTVRAMQARNVTIEEVAQYLGVNANNTELVSAFTLYNNAEIAA